MLWKGRWALALLTASHPHFVPSTTALGTDAEGREGKERTGICKNKKRGTNKIADKASNSHKPLNSCSVFLAELAQSHFWCAFINPQGETKTRTFFCCCIREILHAANHFIHPILRGTRQHQTSFLEESTPVWGNKGANVIETLWKC